MIPCVLKTLLELSTAFLRAVPAISSKTELRRATDKDGIVGIGILDSPKGVAKCSAWFPGRVNPHGGNGIPGGTWHTGMEPAIREGRKPIRGCCL